MARLERWIRCHWAAALSTRMFISLPHVMRDMDDLADHFEGMLLILWNRHRRVDRVVAYQYPSIRPHLQALDPELVIVAHHVDVAINRVYSLHQADPFL